MAKKNRLIRPDQVEQAAMRKRKENLRFRSFLKTHADPEVLDRQFSELHQRIFPRYHCDQCRNCCKLINASISSEDIDTIAAHLALTRQELIDQHLTQSDYDTWNAAHLPCDFLGSDGACTLGDCRPESCKKYPYTNQPERLESLYSILDAVAVCPAAYEIFESLKRIYGFRSFSHRKQHMPLVESDENFAFIAGYASSGFPYGIEWDNDESTDDLSDDLPF